MNTPTNSNYAPPCKGRGKGVGLLFHNLKIALRNMRRFKLQTIVCLTGLAVGMTCFALGTLWLRFIDSFEDFVPEAENVYLASWSSDLEKNKFNPFSHLDMGAAAKDKFSQVEDFCAVRSFPTYSNESMLSDVIPADGMQAGVKINWSDASFFRFFGVKAIEGSTERFGHGSIALTESAALRLFGTKKVLGQQLTVRPRITVVLGQEKLDSVYFVTAVIPDCPLNTQFYYEAIAAHPEPPEALANSIEFTIFVRMHKEADVDSLIMKNHDMIRYEDGHYPVHYDLMFLPLTKLRTDYTFGNVLISTQYVRWFMFIGLLVILCSLGNYVITMVSHLRRRGWEMSLRRVLGSSRAGIINMVCIETISVLLLSALLSIGLTMAVLPTFREYSGITIAWNEMVQRLAAYLLLVIAGGLAVTALTAWVVMLKTQRNVLSSRQHAPSLWVSGTGGETLQLALSMGMIFALVIMLRQVHFIMYSSELGWDTRKCPWLRPNQTMS